jgi:uncharacterized membrane protein
MVGLAFGLPVALLPGIARSQAQNSSSVEQRLEELKAQRDELARTLRQFDSRIDELANEIKGPPAQPIAQPASVPPDPIRRNRLRQRRKPPPPPPDPQPAPPKADTSLLSGLFGSYEPGRGFILTSGEAW